MRFNGLTDEAFSGKSFSLQLFRSLLMRRKFLSSPIIHFSTQFVEYLRDSKGSKPRVNLHVFFFWCDSAMKCWLCDTSLWHPLRPPFSGGPTSSRDLPLSIRFGLQSARFECPSKTSLLNYLTFDYTFQGGICNTWSPVIISSSGVGRPIF